MAVSNDLVHWSRYGDGPVIDNGQGISGDPQIVRIGDLWVMFYFGACLEAAPPSTPSPARTTWCTGPSGTAPHLIAPSEPCDKTFAHKPWLLKHDGVVYHFYCAVGTEGRVIALATSKDLRGGGSSKSGD